MLILLPPPLFNILRFFLFHTILIKHFFLVLRVIKNVTYSRKNHLITWCVPRVLRLRFNHFAFHFFLQRVFCWHVPKTRKENSGREEVPSEFPFPRTSCWDPFSFLNASLVVILRGHIYFFFSFFNLEVVTP